MGELPLNHFQRGAQACREMMARFVEQGGDAVTAESLRANWHPGWGEDPGAPDFVVDTYDPIECPEGERQFARWEREARKCRGSLEQLRLTARMIEEWARFAEPAAPNGQISFTRSMLSSAAGSIRNYLRDRKRRRG